MSSSLLLVAAGCSGPSGSSEQAKAKAKAKATSTSTSGPARISCAKPAFDFGKVAQGTKVKHVFVLENKGGAPLTIKRAAGG